MEILFTINKMARVLILVLVDYLLQRFKATLHLIKWKKFITYQFADDCVLLSEVWLKLRDRSIHRLLSISDTLLCFFIASPVQSDRIKYTTILVTILLLVVQVWCQHCFRDGNTEQDLEFYQKSRNDSHRPHQEWPQN